MQEFAAKSGLSKGYISMLESGKHPQSKRSLTPSIRTYQKIALAMNIPVEDLLRMVDGDEPVSVGGGANAAAQVEVEHGIPDDEYRLLTLWRKADDHDQDIIMHILSRYETGEAEPKIVYIRNYLVPAAAGYASAIEGEDYEWIELPDDAPRGADFCISISGDSMEPYIHDGEMVYVKRGVELHDFEPGIFYVDGNVYCKQFCPGYAGEFYLLSANPRREDANIIVKRDQPYFYFGKVLTKMRLPRPLYY